MIFFFVVNSIVHVEIRLVSDFAECIESGRFIPRLHLLFLIKLVAFAL